MTPVADPRQQLLHPYMVPATVPFLTFILGILSVDMNFDMLGTREQGSELDLVQRYYHRMTHRPLVFEVLVLLTCLGIFAGIVQIALSAMQRRDGRTVVVWQAASLLVLAACKLDIDWSIKPLERELAALDLENGGAEAAEAARGLLGAVYMHHGALVGGVVLVIWVHLHSIELLKR